MGADETLMTFAVAIYIGVALSNFFGAITRDLVTPLLGGLFPGAEKQLDNIVVNT